MRISEFTKSGTFVVVVFVLVIVLLPFGLEQIGETTGFFEFPAKKTVAGWFGASSAAALSQPASKPIDWENYRRDLEEFSRWADAQAGAVILPPSEEPEVIEVVEEETAPPRALWHVPVAGCTAPGCDGSKGYAYIAGYSRVFEEGDVIPPSDNLCGYEIVSIGERTVYFRAIQDAEGDKRMGVVALPDFTRIEKGSLVKGKSRYVIRDAFHLKATGGFLMIERIAPPDEVIFKILDSRHVEVATILCIVIGEKGGK